MTMTAEQLEELLGKVTQGEWSVCIYDAGDKPHYDYGGPCPSIQADDEGDCAIVHWDGFKREYCPSANGDQRQITANATLIALAPSLARRVIAAEKMRVAFEIMENHGSLGNFQKEALATYRESSQ